MKNNIKITKIDGVEYINKYHYDKLLNKKIPKPKEEEKIIDISKYSVSDPANVLAILPIERNKSIDDVIEIWIGKFKEIKYPEVTYFHDVKWNIDSFKIRNTKFSKEYLDNMRKTARVIWGEDMRVFMKINSEGEFEDNYPAIFLFGDKLAFILAPRVESN